MGEAHVLGLVLETDEIGGGLAGGRRNRALALSSHYLVWHNLGLAEVCKIRLVNHL